MAASHDDHRAGNLWPQVLKLDEEQLAALLGSFPDPIFIQTNGRFAYVNQAAVVLFGEREPADLLGRPVAERFPPELRTTVADRIRRLNVGREIVPALEETVLRPDGSRRLAEFSGVPFEHHDQAGALVFVRDVTEQRQAEAALRASEQRLRFALEKSLTGGWDLDLVDHTAFRTVEHDRIFGYDTLLPNWTYERFLEHVLAEDRADVDARFRAAIAAGSDWNFECRIRRRDGHVRWIRAVGGHLLGPDGSARRIAGIVQDITERKDAELERVRLTAQLQQAQKMEAVGLLAGGIAHDFNNLLMVQRGYCEMLRAGLSPDDQVAAGLARIDACAERAAALTRQLLAFSRKQVLQPRPVDLNALVADLDDMLRRLLGEDVELVVVASRQPATVLADPGQLEQVIVNLAANARDAMPDGGRLTIGIEPVDLDAIFAAEEPKVAPGAFVRLALGDRGCGMNEETRRHIFEPFYTTKDAGRGTGLGLSTVYGIVLQSGGTIRVDSEPGHGSTFRIYLPRVDTEPTQPERGVQAVVRGEGECILVVEDDEALRDLTELMLENLGYRPVLAADGEAALRLLEQEGLRPDLIVTDVVMPGMSGRSLADRAAGALPGLKVLYMSGYTRDAIVHRGVLDDGLHFLQKPFSLLELSLRLREVLGR